MNRIYILTKWSSFPYESVQEWTIGVFSSIDTLRSYIESEYKVDKFSTKRCMKIPAECDKYYTVGLSVSQHFLDAPNVDAKFIEEGEEPK